MKRADFWELKYTKEREKTKLLNKKVRILTCKLHNLEVRAGIKKVRRSTG